MYFCVHLDLSLELWGLGWRLEHGLRLRLLGGLVQSRVNEYFLLGFEPRCLVSLHIMFLEITKLKIFYN